jgi:hypothetical protein
MSGSKEKLVSISSYDRFEGTTSEFTVDLKETYSTQTVKRVILTQVQVPNLFENIRSAYLQNNELVFEETGQPAVTISVPQGQYTLSQLITELETLINAALTGGNTVTITANPNTNILTFTSTVAIQYFEAGSTIYPVIGFSGDTASGLVAVGAYNFNLQGIGMVYLHSPDIAQSHGIDPGRRSGLISLLGAISLHEAPFGSNAYFQSDDAETSDVDYGEQTRNLSTIRFVLRSQGGVKLPLPPNVDMKILMKFILE